MSEETIFSKIIRNGTDRAQVSRNRKNGMLVQSEVGSLQELATFQQEELDMLMPLVETGDVARSEIIRMQRTTVDLPEPEGPQITTFSPAATERLMSLRTWKSPNHLFTPDISTRSLVIGGPISITLC